MIKSLISVLKTDFRHVRQTGNMAVIELKKTYSSSTLGLLWAIIKPALFVLVYWFGIQVGIRGGTARENGEPFILWLIAGIMPWFFVSDALVQCGMSIRRQRHLVTKAIFPVATIPVITETALFFFDNFTIFYDIVDSRHYTSEQINCLSGYLSNPLK